MSFTLAKGASTGLRRLTENGKLHLWVWTPDCSLSRVLRRANVPVLTSELAQQGKAAWLYITPIRTNPMCPVTVLNPYPLRADYQVGKTMVDRLKGKGVQVHYDETLTTPMIIMPHPFPPNGCQFAANKPAAIFDIHRTACRSHYYRATIDGQKWPGCVWLWAGKPGMSANMDFARRMMTAANNLHSNVVKEIFVGKGYNQDLTPTAL